MPSPVDKRIRSYASLVLVGVLVLAVLWNQHDGLPARQRETCAAINEVKSTLVSYIDQQLNRAAKSLPTIEYYKQHPVELGRQLAAIERQRQATHEAFAPTSC